MSLDKMLSFFSTLFMNHLDFFKSLAVAAIVVGATLLLRTPLVHLLFKNARRIPAFSKQGLLSLLLDACERPATSALTLVGFYLAAVCIRHSPAFDGWLQPLALRILRIGIIVLSSWALMRFISPDMMARTMFGKPQEPMSKTFCMFFARILRCVAAVFGGVLVVNELGFNPSTLIAGIGVGGLTVALAAQDWASNLFGGAVILFDKPFAVDDWIEVDTTMEGVVEDMTFRTTRIRTFDNSQIVIPNALLVSKPVINWSRMEKRKISFDVSLEYDSPSQQLEECVRQIRAFLQGNEDVNQELISVTFNELGDAALKVRVHFFTNLKNYADFMLFKERVNYKIADIVRAQGLSFAFPTQTLHLKQI